MRERASPIFRLADREYLSARIYEHNSQVPADRYFEPRTMMYENALILHLLLILPSSRRRSQVEIVLYYTDKNYFANESTKKLPVRELIGDSGGPDRPTHKVQSAVRMRRQERVAIGVFGDESQD